MYFLILVNVFLYRVSDEQHIPTLSLLATSLLFAPELIATGRVINLACFRCQFLSSHSVSIFKLPLLQANSDSPHC